MNKFWLPLKRTYRKGNKTTILIIPGASSMDKSQLEDIIQWEEEKMAKEVVKPAPSVMPSPQVKELLLSFANYLSAKRGR